MSSQPVNEYPAFVGLFIKKVGVEFLYDVGFEFYNTPPSKSYVIV